MRRFLLPLIATACASAPPPPPEAKTAKVETPPTCVVNARLLGHDALKTIVYADGAVTGIYEGEVPCGTRIDAEGGWVLPGFHDSHVHMMSGAVALASADLKGAKDAEEILTRVRAFAEAHPDAAWIVGRGWTFDMVEAPTAKMLAPVDPRPIFLESYDGHAAWVNEVALAAAGVEGSGLLLEGAMASVEDKIPPPSREVKLARLSTAVQHVLALGVTSVDDITRDLETFALYAKLDRRGELPIDVTVSVPLDGDLDAYEEHRGPRFGFLKGFVDGVIEAKTAYMLEPYEGATTRGAPLIAPDDLERMVLAADARGFRVALHCIGDAAVRLALDVFAKTKTKGHRIEHIEVADPKDLPRFAKYGVVASMQPYHANPFGPTPDEGVWSKNVGPTRLPNTFPWRALEEAGATLVFGSDWPVMSADPLRGLAVALTRRDEDGAPKDGWNARQTVSLVTALAAYRSGEVREGKATSLVILAPNVDLEDPSTLWRGARVRCALPPHKVGSKLTIRHVLTCK